MSIELKNIHKTYGTFRALNDVSVEIGSGELVALLGPSGSGKTTLLRVIAGLEQPDTGTIAIHGQNATRDSVRARRVGFVFQHYALFRHMTVLENIVFGLKVQPRNARLSKKDIDGRGRRLVELVQLEGLAARYPSQLSGGQRQRVALARALAVEPRVLLLDEPFGALDARVRQDLRCWLRQLHDELGITSVFVTHDQEEALELADRVVVINSGKVEQMGTPEAVYESPATPFVYEFLGRANLFHGRVHRGRVCSGPLEMDLPEHLNTRNLPAVSYVRPHDMEINRVVSNGSSMKAQIRYIYPLGAFVRIELSLYGTSQKVQAEVTKDAFSSLALKSGETVFVTPRKCRVFVNDFQI